jgi:hypothetical protein
MIIIPGLGTPSSHHIVNWKESQINKGLKLAGFKGDIAEFGMPSGKERYGVNIYMCL